MEIFDREFNQVNKGILDDLQSLEYEGSIYARFWSETDEDFHSYRIDFEPSEIVEYVESATAFEEWIRHRNNGLEEEEALEQIDDERIKNRVRDHVEWAKGRENAVKWNFAAFISGDLESLVSGHKEHRYTLREGSPISDRVSLLTDILFNIKESVLLLQDRREARPPYEIEQENDIQDLLLSVIKPIFQTAKIEEWTPKHAESSKRVDLVVPEVSVVVETKYVRSASHAGRIGDELKVDFESYHAHPDCDHVFAVVWDGDSHVADVSNLENDLTGHREKDGDVFDVEVKVIQ